jgi:CBS domain-containing protein
MLVKLNYTWLLVGGLGLWILALVWLPSYLGAVPTSLSWALAALTLVIYLAGLLLAEGVRTRVAGIFSPRWPRSIHLFPYGAAAAYPLHTLEPGRMMRAALAAPLVLAVLGALYWGAAHFLAGAIPAPVEGVLRALAVVNLGVAVLHLLPALPLAGGWFFVGLRQSMGGDVDDARGLMRRVGLVLVLVLVGLGAQVVVSSGDWAMALGVLALAWALREGSVVSERRASTRQMLEHLTAGEVMQPAPATVRPDNTLADVFWDREKLSAANAVPVVDAAGRFAGLLPVSLSEHLLQGTWPTTKVQAVMIPADRLTAVAPNTPVPAVLTALARPIRAEGGEDPAAERTGFVPVVERGTVRGIISHDQVDQYAHLGARVGVQEAAALEGLSAPARSGLAWAGTVLAFFLAVLALSALGNRVVGPTLAAEVTPTPVPVGAITFGDPTPAADAFVGRGATPIQIAIDSPSVVLTVTMTFDGDPLEVTVDPPHATYVTASASAPGYLLGLHTVAVQVETEDGLTGSTNWSFRVTAAGPGDTEPTEPAANPAPVGVTVQRQHPAPGGLLPVQEAPLTVSVDVAGAAATPVLSLDGKPLAATVQPDTSQAGMSRVTAPVTGLTAGPHTLALQVGDAAPITWDFTALQPDATHRFFPETGYFVSGDFLAFWDAHVGLDLFGYPLGDSQVAGSGDDTYTVQYFERARMEKHGDDPVVLGLLGLEAHRPDPAVPALPDARYFAATGHNLSGAFQRYWEARGGLAIFGYPISEAVQEDVNGTPLTVQYFERARFELHPENAGTPWEVTLSPLGAQALAAGR